LFPYILHILIDPNFQTNFPCQAEVVQDAYSVCSDLNNIFLNIFEGSSTHNITFRNVSTLPNNALAIAQFGSQSPNPDGTTNYTFYTYFRNGYLATGTDLAIATTTIHENIHSILLFLYQTDTFPNISENPTYEQLMQAYIAETVSNGNTPEILLTGNPQHDFMAQFVGNIAEAIKAYGISKGYSLPDSFYNALAWSGLTDTPTFHNLYPFTDSNGNINPAYDYILGTQFAEVQNAPAMHTNGTIPYLDYAGNPIVPLGSAPSPCN
jgi:hypothetical protein